MNSFLSLFIISISLNTLAAAENQIKMTLQPNQTETVKAKKSTTEMSFEDLLVNGQYHFSDEAVTTVEEDKVLNSLIGVRTDFKDRIKQSATLGEVKQ